MGLACTATVYLSSRWSGSYFSTAWPLLGAVLVLTTGGLLLFGVRPNRRAALASASLAAFGVWSLASVGWGGVPDAAWTSFDQATIGATALLLGSLLAGVGCAWPTVAGVAAGLTLQAVELLLRLQSSHVPSDWFQGRKVQGPVGYANAQATFLAVGVVLMLWLAADRRLFVRAPAGAACGVLCGTLLLTQSRGALLALAIGLVVLVALSRDGRTLGLGLAAALYTGAMWLPLRHVDKALVDGGSAARTHAFHHYAGWLAAGSLVLCLLAATPPGPRLMRRALILASVAGAIGGGAAVAVLHPAALHSLQRGIKGSISSVDPVHLPGGETRLASVSSTGRREIWSVAASLYEAHPAVGAGAGKFARTWDRKRKENNLSVLQPHSIELETLSELGVPGGVLFTSFVALAFLAVVRKRSRLSIQSAAAAAAFAVFLLQASVDWTFSFPALAVAVLLVAGAAAEGRRSRGTGILTYVGISVAMMALLVGLAGPWLSAHSAAQARAELPRDVSKAWDLAARARGFDRWSSDVVALQGQIAEQDGELVRAASLYGDAAALAQRPWMYEAEQARVLKSTGLRAASRAVCRRALRDNPLELSLLNGVCAGVRP
ncbi:MAG: O-antigen ligase family protein [Actinomycetota bacterium]